jgi:hypothetical protein
MLPSDSLLENAAWAEDEFRRTGVAVFRSALRERERLRLLEKAEPMFQRGKRKDMLMPQSAMTPRHLEVVSGAVMNCDSDIMSSYRSRRLQESLSRIVGEEVVECDNEIENVILTRLSEPGDTHGWHLDDYAIAMIMILEAPRTATGGYVEYVQDAMIRRIELSEGDIYVMRSDKVTHRVAPITKREKRTILNFTYGVKDRFVFPNGSAQTLLT